MMPGEPDRLGVLVTRPARQAQPLCALVEECGGTAIPWPAIEIDAHEPATDTVAALATAGEADLAIFVSRNAVVHGRRLLAGPAIPKIAAIGPSTLRALAAAGLSADFESAGFDSETLLTHPDLQDLSGRQAFIFRGVGGRELLADALHARGANVRYVEVYRRRPRSSRPAERVNLLNAWAAGKIDVYTATSVEILEALHRDLGAEFSSLLAATPLVTASRRVVQRSQELQHRAERILAPGPDDRSLVEAIASWSGRLQGPAIRQEEAR
jgi:uroporphyrinogen-III synthase